MSADEFQELHEHAEHAAHNPSMAPVSLTMAILAVLVAVVSLLGHRTHTEEVVLQTKANDQWAYYQGKDTRLHTDEKLIGLAGFAANSDSSKEAAWVESTKAEAKNYEKQKDDIQAEARKLEAEHHKLELEAKGIERRLRARWWESAVSRCDSHHSGATFWLGEGISRAHFASRGRNKQVDERASETAGSFTDRGRPEAK